MNEWRVIALSYPGSIQQTMLNYGEEELDRRMTHAISQMTYLFIVILWAS